MPPPQVVEYSVVGDGHNPGNRARGTVRKYRALVKIVHRRYYAKSPTRALQLEVARLNAAIAREIYALRKKSGLTQQQLAELVGTKGSVISRLEDDDCAGHSLRMLQRISVALNCRVEI